METVPCELTEIVRIPSPAPAPQALACDGERLWLGSWETSRFYGLDPHQGRILEEWTAPGRPVGATCVGDEVRVVCSEQDDARFIRRFIPGHGFKTREAARCPDDAGSFLAFDGVRLWLGQRHNKRILELDAANRSVRVIPIGEEITGMTWLGRRLYLSLWFGRDRGGCRIAWIEPDAAEPALVLAARSPFAAVSLAHDGARFWTNDFKQASIVAFTLPE
jgi:hypothetical protein